jgi:hypothetical protein
MGFACTPQKIIADELDCLGRSFAEYSDGVTLVFSNGQETSFDEMPEGSCCNSFCHPGNGSCYGST